MSAKARVQILTEGARKLRSVLTGARREVERAERAMQRGGRDTTKEVERQQRRRGRVRRQGAREAIRDAERVADVQEKVEREATREFEKQSRVRTRTAKREARERRRAAERATPLQRAGRAIGFGASALAGGAMAAYSRTSAYAGALGAQSREQLVANAAGFERNLQGLSAKRGLDEQGTDALRQQIMSASAGSGIAQEEVLAGLNQAQARFADQFETFSGQLPELARAAQASGARLEDVITFLGNVGRANPNMSEEELRSVLMTTVDIGNRGSVEFGALAQAFGTIPGEFARGMQAQGGDTVRQMLEVAQLMAAGGSTDSESATMVARTMERLNRADVQRKFQRLTGESATDEQGRLRSLPELATTLQSSGVNTPQKLRELLGDAVEAQQGLGILMQGMRNQPFVEGLRGANAEGGEQYISEYFARLESSGAMRAGNIGIDQFNEFQRTGGIQSDAARQVLDRVETQTKLETKYWEVIDALETFKGALMAVGGLALGSKLLGAAGGAGGAAGMLGLGGGAAAGGSAAAGGAAAAGSLGMGAILPVAAAGAAGYGLGTWIDDAAVAGEGKLSDKVEELYSDATGMTPETTSTRGLAAPGSEGTTTEGLSLTERTQSEVATKIGEAVSRYLGDDIGAIMAAQVRRYDGGPRSR